jgi:hypothetical protein
MIVASSWCPLHILWVMLYDYHKNNISIGRNLLYSNLYLKNTGCNLLHKNLYLKNTWRNLQLFPFVGRNLRSPIKLIT